LSEQQADVYALCCCSISLLFLTTKQWLRKIFDLALIINLFSLATNITKDKHQLVVLDNQTLAEKNVWI
jgi:hypothetical protein